jgi:hypothetical protein
VSGITISNGIVWSRDGRTCWYIDTPTKRVDAFDYDVTTGRLSNRRPDVIFPDGVGFPDGMAIDEHGNLWVAMWGGGCVLCCDPRTGRIIDRIAVPGASKITSCAFGGPQLDTLYITSAGGGEVPDAHALMMKARQLGWECVVLDGVVLPDALVHRVPAEMAHRLRLMPIRLESDRLVLATADPSVQEMSSDLAVALRIPHVSFALTSAHEIAVAVYRYYPPAGSAALVPPESNAGDLFLAHPGVRGVPSTPFAG